MLRNNTEMDLRYILATVNSLETLFWEVFKYNMEKIVIYELWHT